jgi:hypothetical protein
MMTHDVSYERLRPTSVVLSATSAQAGFAGIDGPIFKPALREALIGTTGVGAAPSPLRQTC